MLPIHVLKIKNIVIFPFIQYADISLDGTVKQLSVELHQKRKQFNQLDRHYQGVKNDVEDMKVNVKSQQSKARIDGVIGGDFVWRIQNYVRILSTDNDQLNPSYANDDVLDNTICLDLIESFKVAKEKTQEQQRKVQESAEDEEKTEENMEANREFQKMNSEAVEHMTILTRWRDEVSEQIEKRKDVFIGDEKLRVWADDEQKDFFSYIFRSLCQLFFDLRVVGATLEHFGKEIKKITKKKVRWVGCCCLSVFSMISHDIASRAFLLLRISPEQSVFGQFR